MTTQAKQELRVTLPKLHRNQQKVFDDIQLGTRFTVLRAGRRFGKSRLALILAIEWAVNNGKRVWWVSPSYKISDSQWRQAKRLLSKVWSVKNEIGRYMEFEWKRSDGTVVRGELAFRSADRPDNMRGEGIDLLIIDEAAYVDETVWTAVLAPAITDKQGSVLFISTPNGLNWFYYLDVYGKSEDGKVDGWRTWYFTSYDNPTIPRKEIDSAKRRMHIDLFEQEHLAMFKEDAGQVFRQVVHISTAKFHDRPAPGHMYGMGVDLGRKHDATVISVIDLTTNTQVFIDRFTQIDWVVQLSRVEAAIRRWKPVAVYIEDNFESMFADELMNRGLKHITPFRTSSTSKVPLIENLINLVENKEITLLNQETEVGRTQLNEMRAFQLKRTKSGDNWTYSAPNGINDDTVIALALATKAFNYRAAQINVSPNPFYRTATTKEQKQSGSFMSVAKQRSYQKKKELLDASNQ